MKTHIVKKFIPMSYGKDIVYGNYMGFDPLCDSNSYRRCYMYTIVTKNPRIIHNYFVKCDQHWFEIKPTKPIILDFLKKG